jgi:cation diffusion facilitator CzcD-associated flavoprotein CzcO
MKSATEPRGGATGTVDHEIAVIGSGFSGLGMAIDLKRRGQDDFVVLERADSVGGTWRDNHYPGCACDVPAPVYSFSFAPNPDWSSLYAGQEEIRAYLENCTDRFGVRSHIRFGSGVRSAEWNEQAQRWRLTLDDDSTLTARFLVAGLGGLSRPSYPAIEGLEDFAGPLMHSAAWDHDVELEGKRVAVIGTGASAIQIVPEVAKVASHVDVFQRTAAWVMPRLDVEFSPRAKAVFRRFPITQKAMRGLIWSVLEAAAFPLTVRPQLTRLLEARARRHLERAVPDPELRDRLTPHYKVGCKRILISSDYYPAMARENVGLLTDSIARVTAEGIETADGQLHPADVIVCATGFDIREALTQVEVRGRDGDSLAARWANRIEGYRGTMISGYPNLFMLSGPNTGTGNMSQVFMIEAQIHFVRELLATMRRRGAAAVDVRPEAQAAHNAELTRRLDGTVWLTGGCKSWYLTDEGHTGVLWPGFSTEFRRSLREVHEEELEFSPAPRPSAPPAEPAVAGG